MRVACVSQDPGVAPGRRKGATVHLLAMREAFAALGVEVVAFDESDGARLRAELANAWDEEPFDLVYERYSLDGTQGAEFAHRMSIPFVLEVNAPLAEEEALWRGREPREGLLERERSVFARAARVIAVSHPVARYAVERGAASNRVHVFHNGVDTVRFRPGAGDELREELVPAGRFALGFHGRLRPWHALDRLASVCGELISGGVPLQLVLVGEGDFDAVVDGRVPADHVTTVGWVPHEEVGRYVATFDALPLAYDPDRPCYFSPLKLPEAMACGVVPIVPRCGDLEHIVVHRVNGLVYAAGDMEALAKSIAWLLEDPGRREALAERAVAAASRYSWTEIAAFALGMAPVERSS